MPFLYGLSGYNPNAVIYAPLPPVEKVGKVEDEPETDERFCKWCEGVFFVPKTSQRLYCNDECRAAKDLENQRRYDRKKNAGSQPRCQRTVICEGCGVPFETDRETALFHSVKCREEHRYRERRRRAAPSPQVGNAATDPSPTR